MGGAEKGQQPGTSGAGAMQKGTTGTGAAGGEQAAQGSAQQGAGGGPATTVTAEQIIKTPGAYFGKRVTLTSRVDRTIDPHFFMANQSGATAASGLPVLIAAPAKGAPENQTVTITGTVRPFTITEIERDYDWFKNGWVKEADIDVESTTRPVLIAESVKTQDGQQLVQSGAGTGRQAGDAPAGQPGSAPKQGTGSQPSSGAR
jgi:hypothetical protein